MNPDSQHSLFVLVQHLEHFSSSAYNPEYSIQIRIWNRNRILLLNYAGTPTLRDCQKFGQKVGLYRYVGFILTS